MNEFDLIGYGLGDIPVVAAEGNPGEVLRILPEDRHILLEVHHSRPADHHIHPGGLHILLEDRHIHPEDHRIVVRQEERSSLLLAEVVRRNLGLVGFGNTLNEEIARRSDKRYDLGRGSG